MLRKNVLLTLLITCVFLFTEATAQEKSWMFGPFERAENQQPIIEPTDETTFDCP